MEEGLGSGRDETPEAHHHQLHSSSLRLYSSISSRLSTSWWYFSQWEHCAKMVPLARASGFTSLMVLPPARETVNPHEVVDVEGGGRVRLLADVPSHRSRPKTRSLGERGVEGSHTHTHARARAHTHTHTHTHSLSLSSPPFPRLTTPVASESHLRRSPRGAGAVPVDLPLELLVLARGGGELDATVVVVAPAPRRELACAPNPSSGGQSPRALER